MHVLIPLLLLSCCFKEYFSRTIRYSTFVRNIQKGKVVKTCKVLKERGHLSCGVTCIDLKECSVFFFSVSTSKCVLKSVLKGMPHVTGQELNSWEDTYFQRQDTADINEDDVRGVKQRESLNIPTVMNEEGVSSSSLNQPGISKPDIAKVTTASYGTKKITQVKEKQLPRFGSPLSDIKNMGKRRQARGHSGRRRHGRGRHIHLWGLAGG